MQIRASELSSRLHESGIVRTPVKSTIVDVVYIRPERIEFDIRATYMCRTCPHYGKRWTCPPNIPDIGYYKRLINSYRYGFIITVTMPYKDGEESERTFDAIRDKSVVTLHNTLILLEKYCFSQNKYWTMSLSGGSCRVCKEKFNATSYKCAILEGKPCIAPTIARPAMEGAGIDVFSTCRNVGINLPRYPHPVEGEGILARVGLLMVE